MSLLSVTRAICERFITIPEHDLRLLPAYLASSFVIAITVQRRARSYMRRDGGSWNEINETTIDRAVQQVEALGGLPAKMFEMTADPEADAPPQMDFNLMFSDLPDDWMQAFGLTSDWLSAADTVIPNGLHGTVG